jgi:uncharacterized protein YjiS (DUF1127 family)
MNRLLLCSDKQTTAHSAHQTRMERRMILASFFRLLRDYTRRRTALAAIGKLDDRTLRDLGLSRGQLPTGWGAE